MQNAGIVGMGHGSESPAMPSPRLVKAAHEFEGLMMKELLKPMTADDSLTGGDSDQASGSGSALSEFGCETLGQALSQRGGFGIADRIIGELSPSGSARAASPVTGK